MKEETVILVILLLVVMLIAIGIWCGIAWLAVAVAGGFGYDLPYWPTVGAVFLVVLMASILKGK